MRLLNITNNTTNEHDRHGVAATEFAVCLPVLLLIVFGIIECCHAIYVKQALTTAAYEGVRAGLMGNDTNGDILLRSNQVLADRKIDSATVNISPNDISGASYGDFIEVSVEAPYAGNSVLPGWFFTNLTLRGKVRMMKEF